MEIKNERIDAGKAFDWGRTSSDYGKYRDIYPQEFYDKIVARGLGVKGQRCLDIGTGTGVIPRNLYHYGANWIGTDISENQIAEAKRMSWGMDIEYQAAATEELSFEDGSFDVITACQCFWYFEHGRVLPMLNQMLKKNGRLLLLYMAWLPFEDKIAGESERLVLKYSPNWSGAGETRHPIWTPEGMSDLFEAVYHEEFDMLIPFTRETWNGRMKACRGVGASLTPWEIDAWEREHLKMLEKIAPESFEVLHYGALLEFKPRRV